MQNILYNPDFALTQHHLITILFSFFRMVYLFLWEIAI